VFKQLDRKIDFDVLKEKAQSDERFALGFLELLKAAMKEGTEESWKALFNQPEWCRYENVLP
jgi:hypothetical protein